MTAGVNSQEQAGIGATNQLQGTTSGYLDQAGNYAQQSTGGVNPTALNGAAISQYESPYQSDVVNATMAEIANQNAQQSQQLTSSAIGSGAFGGDRAGVAQAALAGQQDLASNQTLAGLNQSNYAQALATAQGQQSLGLSAGQANRAALQEGSQLEQGLGATASSTGVANANAQLQGGLLEQQTQQASDTANYNQFEQQQAYPFQTAQFLAGITGSLAPELGSSTSGTGYQQSSPPNPLNAIIGAGLGASAFMLSKGGRVEGEPEPGLGAVSRLAAEDKLRRGEKLNLGEAATILEFHSRARGGVVPARSYAGGGVIGGGVAGPYGGAPSYVPSVGLAAGQLQPSGGAQPSMMTQPQTQASAGLGGADLTAGAKMFGKGLSGSGLGDSISDFAQDSLGLARGGVAGAGLAAGGPLLPRRYAGGVVPAGRYDDGGGVVPAGVAGPYDPSSLAFDPSALGVAAGAMQPGLGGAAMPSGVAAGRFVSPAPATNDNPPPQGGVVGGGVAGGVVPVAPAPNVTPVTGYKTLGDLPPPPPSGGVSGPAPTGVVPPAPPSNGVAAIDSATAPRSVRNNNPGNIIDGKYAQGLPGYAGSDGRFAIFKTPEDGSTAMDGLLNSYGRQGLTTPLQIISKWSPAGDGNNDPGAYASRVAKTLGIGVNDPIDMSNPTQRAALGKAMSDVEAGRSSGVAASALAYAGGLDPSAPPGLGNAVMATDPGSPASQGLGGLLHMPHLTDDQRSGLLAAGLGMMASGSRSWGQALGEGGLKGVQGFDARTKLGQEQQKIELLHKEFLMNLDKAHAQIKNYDSENEYRRGLVANEANRVNLDRFEMIPGPEGTFRYFDKLNPQSGLLTANQLPPGVGTALHTPAPAAVSASPSGGGQPPAPVAGAAVPAATASNGSAPAAGGQQQLPTQLDSTAFVKSGNPTLRAPEGYTPTNYWTNVYRSRNDPVMRETLARQSVEDVADANKRATKAYSSMYYSDQMDKSIAGLPQNGLLAPGAFFNERLGLAKNWNAIAGLVPGMAHMTVDENAVAKGEGLIKDKTRLGADLTSALGSREAASVFSSMMAAVPGGDNTRQGYKNISSAIRALSQREIDHNAFMQDWSARYGNTNNAEVAFNQLNPATQYARQAESLARIPQRAVDMLRANSKDPTTISNFETVYGRGLSRYYTGQFAQ